MINNKLKEIKAVLLSTSNERNISKSIVILESQDQVDELLNTEYSQANELCLGYEICLWRGILSDNEFMIQKPVKRKSAYTDNYYTILFSEVLPSWKNYPKRNHSIICTNNQRYTEDFGNTFMAFPKNNSILGICPEYDLWYSFDKYNDGYLDRFNIDFSTLIDLSNYNDKINDKKSMLKFMKYLQEWSHTDQYEIAMKEETYDESSILNHTENLLEHLDNILSPYKNNFKLSSIEDLIDLDLENNEIWFDNDCLLIKY